MSRIDPDRVVAPSPLSHDRAQPMSAPSMLDDWTTHDWSDGVDLTAVGGLDVIEVTTERSVYVVVRAGGREMLVKGGQYLPAFRAARSVGCSLGGAFLKEHAVAVGFRMELAFDDLRLVTSEIKHIRVLPARQA